MISYLANPQRFLNFERIAAPIFLAITILCLSIGLWYGLLNSPADYKQGETVRIMYIHVPAAWGAMMAYAALAIASFVSFVWRHTLADYGARAFALIGTVFTGLALITGSLWGKATWKTWWQWDFRMTSVLVLFFIYIGYLCIWHFVDDKKRASRLASIVAMVGLLNLPIIKFSVEFQKTSLHQPASISKPGAPGLPSEMLTPLLIMATAYTALFAWLSLKHVKTDILRAQSRRKKAPKTSTQISIEDV